MLRRPTVPLSDELHSLLVERRDLRQRLHSQPEPRSAASAALAASLSSLDDRCRRQKRGDRRRHFRALEAGMQEAWRTRDLREAYRLARVLTGGGAGPRGRLHLARTEQISPQKWAEYFALPAALGGCSAQRLTRRTAIPTAVG